MLARLRNELCSDSFHAVLAWSCGRAKCQCCTATVTVVVYSSLLILFYQILRKPEVATSVEDLAINFELLNFTTYVHIYESVESKIVIGAPDQ